MQIDQVADELLSEAAADIREIVGTITLAVALERDKGLQYRLRQRAGVAEAADLLLTLPMTASRVIIASNSVLASRDAHGTAFNLNMLADEAPPLHAEITQACSRVAADVTKLFDPVITPGRVVSREDFLLLRRWSPLIERPAYRLSARLVTLLEGWRPSALLEAATLGPAHTNGPLARYYALAHGMAHLLLATSAREARPWLVDMAKSVGWLNWTPTIGLIRERTMWLTAAAIRSVADFGPDIVPLYFGALDRANHAVKVFDALTGLVAIAVANPEAFNDVEKGIAQALSRAQSRDDEHLRYSQPAFVAAGDALRAASAGQDVASADFKMLDWQPRSSRGLCTGRVFRVDPTDLDAKRRMIGLCVVPSILRAPLEQHYPIHAERASNPFPRARSQKTILLRAWRSGPSAPTLH